MPVDDNHTRPRVIVTGYGANRHGPGGNTTSNPAGIIASSLPKLLSASDPLNSSGVSIDILDGVAGGWAEISGLHQSIRNAIRAMHEKHAEDVDLFVHLGRGPWDFFSIERRAFRQDMTCTWLVASAEKEGYYVNPDNEMKYVRDMEFPWKDVPMGLQSDVPIAETVDAANRTLHGNSVSDKTDIEDRKQPLTVRPHFEPGQLGCGFTYYESMAHRYVHNRKRNVLFCHVPPGVDEQSIDAARQALLAVIGAAVHALREEESDKSQRNFRLEFGKQTG